MAGFDPSELIRNLQAAESRATAAAARACGEFAEYVLAESQELCPVSPTNPNHPLYIGTSGALRDSGTVKAPVVSGGTINVEIGYNADYAAAVHERLDAAHRYPGAGNPRGQAKFLESAIRDNAERFTEYVGEAVRKAIG